MAKNEPAFPNGSGTYAGLTLRDYFAGQALPIFRQTGALPEKEMISEAARLAYLLADAMLAEREKSRD